MNRTRCADLQGEGNVASPGFYQVTKVLKLTAYVLSKTKQLLTHSQARHRSVRGHSHRDGGAKMGKQMITAHIDRQTKTIDGVTFTNTHSGQKRAYGDSFYEYTVTSDLPAEEVEKVCRERVYKSSVTEQDWLADYRKPGCSMEDAFRPYYKFEQIGPGKFSYIVTCLYAD